MCHVLRTRTELKHRDDLGEGIDGQPQPEDLCGSAQPGSQFVQLETREVQVAEGAFMEVLSMLPARVSQELMVALRPVRRRKHPALRPALSATWRRDRRGSSDGREGYGSGQ